MCGIVGYVGKNNDIRTGLEALKRLEYRGYDSAGMAVYDSTKERILSVKAVGKIENLEKKLSEMDNITGNPFLFYTRWATHGEVTEENCHPHDDCKHDVWVAHNGIIENYLQLRQQLIAEGHVFTSETDSEVVPHLIEKFMNGSLEEAVSKAAGLLEGAYALVVIGKDDPTKLIAVRNSAPLIIGVGEGEYIAASDASAIVGVTKEVIYLDDKEMAIMTSDGYTIKDINGEKLAKSIDEIDWDLEATQKGGYDHFMIKEIMEQPESISDAMRGKLLLETAQARLGGLKHIEDRLKHIDRINIIASGSGYYTAMVGEYMIEEYARIQVDVDSSAEFRYRNPIIDDRTAYIFISQSGETADTLAALREVKSQGGLTLGIINVVGSSIAREVDAGIYNHAGPEIGVATTKAFTSQLVILVLLTLYFARQRDASKDALQEIAGGLSEIPSIVRAMLSDTSAIQKIAEQYKDATNFMFIGRRYNYPIALEGALKLKEISYIHAEGFGGGELKHGPIAMIEEGLPTVALCPSDSVYAKMVSNIQEIKTRKGPVIAVATQGNQEIQDIADHVIYIPHAAEMLTPILAVIPLQLFAYYIGVSKGYDVDKPRNLAKSVTVE